MLILHSLSKSDKIIFKEIFYDDVYDEGLRGLGTVKNILDIGANFGGFVVYAADRYPNAKIEAYEPTMEQYVILDKNIELNKISDRVIAYHVGVWSSEGFKKLYQYNGGGLNSLVYATIDELPLLRTVEVYCLPLDFIIGVKTIDLLKIDCEGSEYEILYNCKKLSQIRRIVGEYHEFDYIASHNGITLERRLKEAGFKTYFRHDSERKVGYFHAKK